MKAQKITLEVDLLAAEWLDEQEAINQVSQILKEGLRNDPHVSFFDCDLIETVMPMPEEVA